MGICRGRKRECESLDHWSAVPSFLVLDLCNHLPQAPLGTKSAIAHEYFSEHEFETPLEMHFCYRYTVSAIPTQQPRIPDALGAWYQSLRFRTDVGLCGNLHVCCEWPLKLREGSTKPISCEAQESRTLVRTTIFRQVLASRLTSNVPTNPAVVSPPVIAGATIPHGAREPDWHFRFQPSFAKIIPARVFEVHANTGMEPDEPHVHAVQYACTSVPPRLAPAHEGRQLPLSARFRVLVYNAFLSITEH